MTNEARLDLWLLDLLHQGEHQAIKGNALRQLAGFKTIRELRAEVERERNAGAVILTSGAGYFLPELTDTGQLTPQGYADTKRFYRQQTAKGHGTLRSAQSAEQAMREYVEYGFSLFGGGEN